jgi:hypothetical protein
MTKEDLDEAQKEAQQWVDQRWGNGMPASQARGMAKTVLKLLEYIGKLTEEQCALQEEVANCYQERREASESLKIANDAYGQVIGIRSVLPLLDELFFNTDGDPDFTKFMAAEQAYQKFRGRDE